MIHTTPYDMLYNPWPMGVRVMYNPWIVENMFSMDDGLYNMCGGDVPTTNG